MVYRRTDSARWRRSRRRKRRKKEKGIESEREREKMEVRRNVGLNVGIGWERGGEGRIGSDLLRRFQNQK